MDDINFLQAMLYSAINQYDIVYAHNRYHSSRFSKPYYRLMHKNVVNMLVQHGTLPKLGAKKLP